MIVKTVNLKEIANAMNWKKEDSVYRKTQRFFSDFKLSIEDLVQIILDIISIDWAYFLSMDRTNWKYGKVNINILTIGIVYGKVAIPIYWKLLDKRWNSNSKERKGIMKKVIEILWWKENITWILADREFIGQEWFEFLIAQNIPFWIRVKENFQIDWSKKSILSLFRWLWSTPRVLKEAVKIKWNKVYISGVNNRWENLIIASNIQGNNAIEYYKKRRSIEVLFSYMKTTWFNFEDTHLTNHERISKLVGILGIAVVWCYKVWELQEKSRPTNIKKHWRKAISTFKIGLRIIASFFYWAYRCFNSSLIFKVLSCT